MRNTLYKIQAKVHTRMVITSQIIIILMIAHTNVHSQTIQYEITGKIHGNHSGKMYLFFDGDTRKRDSISSDIINGSYRFTGEVNLPILARIHLGKSSFINDVYIDKAYTQVDFDNTLYLSNNNQDTLNQLLVRKTIGSKMEKAKSDFETWKKELYRSDFLPDEKREAYFRKLSDFVTAHRNSKLSAYLLGKADALSYHQVLSLSEMIDTSLKDTYEVKLLKRQLLSFDKARFLKAGTRFYDSELSSPDGRLLSTKDLRKKLTLYEFWASWCGPCRMGNPDLRRFYIQYKDKGLEIVGISIDKDLSKWRDAIIKDQLTWPQLIDSPDSTASVFKYYGLKSIPYNILVDANGSIVGTELSITEIENIMKKEK